MGLMGTLAKVAIGYAAARGVDHLSKNNGLGGLLGGAQVPSGQARTQAGATGLPGMDQLQQMMQGGAGQMQEMMGALAGGGAAAGGLQDMMSKMMGGGAGAAGNIQEMMAGLMGGGGGATTERDGGLLSGGGGAGLAGLLAMAGGAAAASGKGIGGLMDAINPKEAAPEAEEAAGLMLRAMLQAAKADGEIDSSEQAKITGMLGDDSDPEDVAFLRDQLAAPVDIDELAKDTPAHLRMQVYSMSLMPIRVDTPAEAQYLDRLAAALGLDQATVNALHVQMGVQPLYN